ncbi:WhiB family transcriptional regulator [Streptomyces sp. NPDC085944]|uniref:WhiB family transcriptional regulator n=1 Tax=Streptomyces sp. NPDC085944 TaxID=3154962 RepID=UPI0034483051
MTTSAAREDWRSQAACAGDTSTFHKRYPAPAKEVCGRCPVRAECLYDAVATKAPHGVWGGLTREERKLLPVLPTDKTKAIGVLRDVLDTADPAAEEHEEQQPTAAPRPARSNGGRYTPEQRAVVERRTIELLRARASYSEIKAELGISAPTIIRIRRRAGLPPSGRTGSPPSRTKAAALAENVEPYGDGHARWTGPMSGRMAQLHAEQRRFNARRVVFEEHHGRAPVGYVRSNCGEQACFAGAHLTDDLMRNAAPSSAPQRPAGAPSERTRPAVTTTPHTTEAVSTSKLLAWAEDHPDPNVQAQGARIEASLVGLRQRYDADQELTAITAKRARLEKELTALAAREAELAPAKKKRRSGAYVRDYDTRTVRAWAVENDIACPTVGQIPKRVLDAWRAANAQTGGGTS